MTYSDEYDPQDHHRIRLKRRDKVTKEFVYNYIMSGARIRKHRWSDGTNYEISCSGVWPWWNWSPNKTKMYLFNNKTQSIIVTGYCDDRYLSKNSEEYKGVMLFILEKQLSGEFP